MRQHRIAARSEVSASGWLEDQVRPVWIGSPLDLTASRLLTARNADLLLKAYGRLQAGAMWRRA